MPNSSMCVCVCVCKAAYICACACMCCVFSGLFSWWSSLLARLVLMHFFLCSPHSTHTHTHTHTHTQYLLGVVMPQECWLIDFAHLTLSPNLAPHTLTHPNTICFTVTELKRYFHIPETCAMFCVRMGNTIFCLPQAVCSRRSWWLILPALSRVFRPPHQQVRDEWLHLTRINCHLLLYSLSAPPPGEVHLCFIGYLPTDQKRQLTLSGQ